jgi:branched-subunit amino acid transport protein AzlD
MRPDTGTALVIIGIVALVTFFTRVLPFLFFKNRETPKIIAYLGQVLPMAIMAMLMVYCLKSISFTAYPYGLPECIAIAIVVLLHIWKRNTLISILAGTVAYMLLVQIIFA